MANEPHVGWRFVSFDPSFARPISWVAWGALLGALATPACSDLRVAGATISDGGATLPAPTDDGGGAPEPAARLNPPDDTGLPAVTYRGVAAVSRERVFVVGDETILEFDGKTWRVVPVGGVVLYGAWADADDAWAVGVVKNTNTGVFMHRDANTWIQFATVPHGLRAIYGSGSFRMATGNDGVVYSGTLPQPFAKGSQLDRAPGIPETVASPILYGVAGNSPRDVVVAGDVGAFYRYRGGDQWATAIDPTDRTRAYRSVFGAPGAKLDVILGANYFGLWRYRGATDEAGNRIPTEMLYEERDSAFSSQEHVTGIWGTSAEHFVAVGTSGRLMVFERGKPVTVLTTRAGARDFFAVSGTSFEDVWVVGADGVILHGAIDG